MSTESKEYVLHLNDLPETILEKNHEVGDIPQGTCMFKEMETQSSTECSGSVNINERSELDRERRRYRP